MLLFRAFLGLGLFAASVPSGRAERAELPEPRFDPPPRLAATSQELATRKSSSDFAELRARSARAADALLKDPPELPEGPASWIFYYANPRTGTRLVPLSATEHKDPVTGEIFTDERACAAYRAILHDRVEEGALTLAWGYADTGDDRYAAGARRILRKLAEDYPGYPSRQDRWGRKGWFAPLGGSRRVQSLDEAVGIIKLAKAYDLTRQSSVFSEEDRRMIEENLFRGTARTLLWFNQGTSNHQTWYNAGLLAVASVLEDAELARKVITMRGGFHDQLERSVGSDGLWCEGTMAYHNYALQAMIEIVEAGRRMDWPLDQEPKFRALFTGPLHAAYPDGSFPVINDSDPLNIASMDRFFHWAWETWRDPLFAQALARGDTEKLRELTGLDLRPAWPLALRSEVLADAGLVALRMGAGEGAVGVFLDYGPHGGGHGHYDKLNLLLFANGREWLLDPGHLTYSHPEYKTWVKTTAAHNTMTLNGRSQAAAAGRLLYLEDKGQAVSAGVACQTAYPGVDLERHVLLTRNFLVDIYDARAPHPVQMDLFQHVASERVEAAAPLSASTGGTPGKSDGYQHLKDSLWFQPTENSTWDFKTKSQAKNQFLRVHFVAAPGEEIISCSGIGYTIDQKIPTLIRRRQAADARFIAVYDLSGDGSAIRGISEERGAIRIETPTGDHRVLFDGQGRLVLEEPS